MRRDVAAPALRATRLALLLLGVLCLPCLAADPGLAGEGNATGQPDLPAGADSADSAGSAGSADVEDLPLLQAILEAMQAQDWPAALPLAESYLDSRLARQGPDHSDTLQARGTVAYLLFQLNRLDEAETAFVSLLADRERLLGPDHPDTIQAVTILAGVHDAREHWARSVPLHQRVLAWQRAHRSPADRLLAETLTNLAWSLDALGRHAEARPFYEEAVAVREATSGDPRGRVLLAKALANLANLDMTQGRTRDALARQQRSLALLEEVWGPEHPDMANACNNMGMFLDAAADPVNATAYLERAIAIYERTLGPEDAALGPPLNNLAQVRQGLGDFAGARVLLERSLAIRERAHGPAHPITAQAIHNLAALDDAQGRYDLAKTRYEDALIRLQAALGPEHPQLAVTLNNLAVTMAALGDFNRAEALQREALRLRQAAFGQDHPATANSLHNLAMFLYQRKRFDEAGDLLLLALDILRRVEGPEHPSLGEPLASLCGVRAAQGRPEEARPFCDQALALRRAYRGDAHLETLVVRHALAGLDHDAGRRAEALDQWREVRHGLVAFLGPEHPIVGKVETVMGRVNAALGDDAAALAHLLRAQAIDAAMVDSVMAVTVESEKLGYLRLLEDGLHTLLSLVAGRLRENGDAVTAAFDLWLRRKGLALEAQKRFQEALFASPDPAVRGKLLELAALRGRLAAMTFGGPGDLAPEDWRARLAALRQRKDMLEQEIAREFAPLARERRRAGADAATLSRLLPPGSALVEFARVRECRFEALHEADRWGPPRYVAFVLRPGQEGGRLATRVELVDLGDAASLEALAAELRTAVREVQDPAARRALAAGRALHDRLIAPLRPALGEAREVYLSPDGALNLVPFEILVNDQGRFLLEEFTFHYLAAGRDLAAGEPGLSEGAAGNPPLLLGNPAFDLPPDAATVPEADGAPPSPALPPPATRGLRALRFSPLPGAEEEVRALAELLPQATLLLGANATEAALRAHPRPALLHLATHGFFLADEDLPAVLPNVTPGGRGEGGLADAGEAAMDYASPLLRSGLALGGANVERNASDAAVGLLTAEKVLALDLQGVSLATLSACDTGAGEALAGEGVFGLRRAFLQAGARRVVMSLWSVPDEETSELMRELYRLHLQEGLSPSRALRQAALRQLELTRRRLGVAHPFYWGAFILVGEP